MEQIKKFSKLSEDSNGTIWFGHFPTSTIYSTNNLKSLFNNGVAYLCGHLHTLGGLLPSMYSRHSNGLLELELGDWKDNRMFRILAFDSGIFSFRDFKLKKNLDKNTIFILITNPKDFQFKTEREPFYRARYSTHIRFLVFSRHQIASAKVFVNDLPKGRAIKANNSDYLYTLEWNAFEYSTGVHKIRVVVEDDHNNIQIVSQQFSLDNSVKSFGILSNFILLVDQIYFVGFLSERKKNIFYIFLRLELLFIYQLVGFCLFSYFLDITGKNLLVKFYKIKLLKPKNFK